MESDLLPEKIYKYTKLDQNFYDLLIGQRLWFSNPQDFNDPFDNNINFNEELDEEELESLLRSEKFKHDPKTLISHLKKNPQILDDTYDKLKHFIRDIGICCFSEIQDNLLMWAHYSNCHKGVCIEFDVEKLKTIHQELKRVNYQKLMPDIKILDIPKGEIYGELPFYKSDHWSYEQEIRVWAKSSGAILFPIEALSGIIFGLKMTDEQMTTICRLMIKLGYSNVKFYKAELHPKEYKLNFVDINVIDEEHE
ncbi:DUF2971 domain-containing protein [Mucilaginibacter sp. HMF5004]|uniref:DUF2971 domain-containing protein n=1 Tax=Mucilaginibacter rivuli TaxID=2857527 RepID=UPI001C5E100D|nr:DUF2971 domain-containing protein [Mucilaginibacter rivuli]MBW4891470.1 DUF2971 domain-containing protein [Mucilaginibacter rivuli]